MACFSFVLDRHVNKPTINLESYKEMHANKTIKKTYKGRAEQTTKRIVIIDLTGKKPGRYTKIIN